MAVLLAWNLASAGPPRAEKTQRLEALGRTRVCDAAPGLTFFLHGGGMTLFNLDAELAGAPGKPAAKGAVIGFFATWCVPCRQGLKDLQRLAPWAEKQGVRVVLVALPPFEADRPLDGYLKELGITLPVIHDKFGSQGDLWLKSRAGGSTRTQVPRTAIVNNVPQLVAAFGTEGRDYEKAVRTAVTRLDKLCTAPSPSP